MKKTLFLFTVLLPLSLLSQNLYFPPTVGNTWTTMPITDLGWCQDKVDSLYSYLEGENSKAFILLKDGKIRSQLCSDPVSGPPLSRAM